MAASDEGRPGVGLALMRESYRVQGISRELHLLLIMDP